MTTNDNVTLGEAAKAVGLHFNTIRNWRKQGRLESAQKVIEKGVEIWVVSLSEVQRIATETNNIRPPQPYNKATQQTFTPGQANDQQAMTTNPAALAIGEAVNQAVKPLTDLVERQSNQIKEMSEELGTLKERIRTLEQINQVTQAAPPAPAGTAPAAGPPPDPTRRGFWRRLLGG